MKKSSISSQQRLSISYYSDNFSRKIKGPCWIDLKNVTPKHGSVTGTRHIPNFSVLALCATVCCRLSRRLCGGWEPPRSPCSHFHVPFNEDRKGRVSYFCCFASSFLDNFDLVQRYPPSPPFYPLGKEPKNRHSWNRDHFWRWGGGVADHFPSSKQSSPFCFRISVHTFSCW